MRRLLHRLSLDMQRTSRQNQRVTEKSQLSSRHYQSFQATPPLGWQSRASHSYFVR